MGIVDPFDAVLRKRLGAANVGYILRFPLMRFPRGNRAKHQTAFLHERDSFPRLRSENMKKSKTKLGKIIKTNRNFPLIEFKDYYETPCSLQMSSLAIYTKPGTSAVWLGTDDAKPQVLASQAARFGVKTEETTGWVSYPIPEDVSLTTRMHLGREQVSALIVHLKNWLEKDRF